LAPKGARRAKARNLTMRPYGCKAAHPAFGGKTPARLRADTGALPILSPIQRAVVIMP
jgi:hypothetical protein